MSDMFDKEVVLRKVLAEDQEKVSHHLDSLIKYGKGEYLRKDLSHFIGALVDGDLFEAVGRADDVNIHYLRDYVIFMYNEMPGHLINLNAKRLAVLEPPRQVNLLS